MRRTALLAAAVTALGAPLAGCGGSDEREAVGGGLPTITKQADGTGLASAPDGTAANHWCTLLQGGEGTTPSGTGRLPDGVRRVTFRLRDTGADIDCRIP